VTSLGVESQSWSDSPSIPPGLGKTRFCEVQTFSALLAGVVRFNISRQLVSKIRQLFDDGRRQTNHKAFPQG